MRKKDEIVFISFVAKYLGNCVFDLGCVAQ